MDSEKRQEFLDILGPGYQNIKYENCKNGITIYYSNFSDTIFLLNILGSIGAYFNMGYDTDNDDPIDKANFTITVIDFDKNWKTHSHSYI